ncbi:YciI family protein [Spirosoma sp. KUDC1026]|uniref:YciI family protein n=1 Tax=Spirosoma sp. KUDC1026 TaxID=2745947 RepID=UPI00159BB6AC|nr:YciI family protein [Spirosoma sp. KUDC1026]QKZ13307.1 hypothetical protein HU175_11965 [Spirosoma sp. KUDC1026]
MQYVIYAYDYTDADALSRRMAVRPAHLAYVRQLKANGQFVMGGALLNDAGQMIGSMLVLELESEAQLETYLQEDPYLVEGVWDKDKLDSKPFRPAVV